MMSMEWYGIWNNYDLDDVFKFKEWCEINCFFVNCGYEVGDEGILYF